MSRRGFLAEIQHQMTVAARRAEQAQRAAAREHQAALRRAEQATKQAERARLQAARASAADKKKAEAEARRLRIEAREAEVAERNAALAKKYDEIDSLLAATLKVDDYVDLDTLRRTAQHPAFERADLEAPTPPPPVIGSPPEPTYRAPPTPGGLAGVFGKKKHAQAVEEATAAYEQQRSAWQAEVAQIPSRQQALAQAHQETEAQRLAELEKERLRYQEDCAARERDVQEANAALDRLITGLGYGTAEAVQEYVSIVLSNSVYPESFSVAHEFSHDASTAELRMRVKVPPPVDLPSVKAYKYSKATDEISSVDLPLNQRKQRYAAAIHQVALRSLHEVFEADRRGLIRSISLEVGTEAIDPATGRRTEIPLLAVAANRERFVEFDLSAVVPTATLEHLGATVSKNPFDLLSIDAAGVRRT